jgi:hypothetical protein
VARALSGWPGETATREAQTISRLIGGKGWQTAGVLAETRSPGDHKRRVSRSAQVSVPPFLHDHDLWNRIDARIQFGAQRLQFGEKSLGG